jgi:cell cycle checkpoint control protein RAD9A
LIITDSRRAAVRTELCLEPLEFDSLTVGADTTVTFSLRELRALLQFAEATNLPVSAHFEVAGR